jgi:predicted kinase
MNKRLLMLVGIAGSGKSTWAREYAKDQARQGRHVVIISRDAIRFALVDECEGYFSKEADVFRNYIFNIQNYLNDDDVDIVIADATHINEKSRAKVLKKLNLRDVLVEAVIFQTPVTRCIQQNKTRIGRERVPDVAIYNMQKNFTMPTNEEGFNIINDAGAVLYHNEANEMTYLKILI